MAEPARVHPSGHLIDDLDAAARVLSAAGEVALACHVNPDGDALGSMLALSHVLREQGKATFPSFPEPFVISPRYQILPGLDHLLPPSNYPARPPVVATFDCGSADRTGSLRPALEAAGAVVNIDHHVSNTRFGTVNLVLADYAASAQVVFDLCRHAGWELTRDAAFCLYVGLATDTGRFQYSNTTPAVFAMAAELARFDLPIDLISRTMFAEDAFSYLSLLGDVLAKTEIDPALGLVSAVMTIEDRDRHGVAYEETDGLIDDIRRAREADVACVVKEVEGVGGSEAAKVSLRSLGRVDVCAIATAAGGGGHRLAAGFTFAGSAAAALAHVKAALPARP